VKDEKRKEGDSINGIKRAMINNVANKKEIKDNVLNRRIKKEGRFNMKKSFKIALAALVVTLIGTSGYYYQFLKADSFITIDINPSIEIITNRNGDILSYNALNEDAEILLSDLKLKGEKLENGTEKIIKEATEMGYIDETEDVNSVLITVYEDDQDKQEEVLKTMENAINEVEKEKGIDIEIEKQGITEEIKDRANDLGISNGKMMYIENMVSKFDELDVNTLANMNMREISKKVKEVKDSEKEKNNDDNGKSDEEIKKDLIEKKNEIKEKHEEKVQKEKPESNGNAEKENNQNTEKENNQNIDKDSNNQNQENNQNQDQESNKNIETNNNDNNDQNNENSNQGNTDSNQGNDNTSQGNKDSNQGNNRN